MSISERVSRVFVDGMGMEQSELAPDTTLKEGLGIDSTEMVELIVSLEREFGVKIPDGVITGGSSIKELVAYFSRAVIQ